MIQKVKPSTLADTSALTGTYGGSTQHAVFTVDQQGRLTYVANATPSIAASQITGSISASQITSVANTQITGLITSSQITSVANTQITGLITSSQLAGGNNISGTSTGISSGSWTISISGTKVNFAYNGTAVFSVDSSGNIIAKGDITGFGTP